MSTHNMFSWGADNEYPQHVFLEKKEIEVKIQEIFLEKFANPINKRVHSTILFIRFASLKGNISCILNSVCINIYYLS